MKGSVISLLFVLVAAASATNLPNAQLMTQENRDLSIGFVKCMTKAVTDLKQNVVKVKEAMAAFRTLFVDYVEKYKHCVNGGVGPARQITPAQCILGLVEPFKADFDVAMDALEGSVKTVIGFIDRVHWCILLD